MKTQEQLKRLIEFSKDQYKRCTDSKSAKVHKEEVTRLNNYLLYLQQNPGEEFLKKQLADIEKRLSSVENTFITWHQKNKQYADLTKARSAFNTVYGIAKMKAQIKTLTFLLN